MGEDADIGPEQGYARQVAAELTAQFNEGRLDLSLRGTTPVAGWSGMPEFYVVEALRQRGVSDLDVRLFITFSALMDRARDADRLWQNAQKLFEDAPWTFDPRQVRSRSIDELRAVLLQHRVSQRHGLDSLAWRTVAESLLSPEAPPEIRTAVFDGVGDAGDLMRAVRPKPWFPLLRGPKISVMWIRMLAAPGGATISRLELLPVAVDVQVRKVTEYLGVTRTMNATWRMHEG